MFYNYLYGMLTGALCLHVGTKSGFQEEASRTVHNPQGNSMSNSYLKSWKVVVFYSLFITCSKVIHENLN